MRVLFATAVACLTLAACGQADPLPTGMASRITAADNVFSLAVPEGWSDRTDSHGGPSTRSYGVAIQQLVVGPAAQPKSTVTVVWDPTGRGILLAGEFEVNATIAGESVSGFKTLPGVLIQFEHSLNGKRTYFNVTCSPDLASHVRPNSDRSDPCLGVVDSWSWEPPSSSHVMPVVAGLSAERC